MKVVVPMYKESKGEQGFPVFGPGHYEWEVTKCEVKPPKNPAPEDDWSFTLKCLAGPPFPTGGSTVGKKFIKMFFIKREDHPNYLKDSAGNPVESDMNVDEMKSFGIACGVAASKTGALDTESFPGSRVACDISVYVDKKGKDRNRTNNWVALD